MFNKYSIVLTIFLCARLYSMDDDQVIDLNQLNAETQELYQQAPTDITMSTSSGCLHCTKGLRTYLLNGVQKGAEYGIATGATTGFCTTFWLAMSNNITVTNVYTLVLGPMVGGTVLGTVGGIITGMATGLLCYVIKDD